MKTVWLRELSSFMLVAATQSWSAIGTRSSQLGRAALTDVAMRRAGLHDLEHLAHGAHVALGDA
jgi:hypothetical protein